jgi:hypothetical protein
MTRYFGAVLAGLGAFLLAYGITLVIGQAKGISGDAVARGTTGTSLAFESRDPSLTVYLNQDGIANVNDIDDRLSAATTCTVTASGGYEHSFSGARQGTAATLGDWVSVGSFTLPGSAGRITCTMRPSGIVGATLPFVVTPHSPGEAFKSIGAIIGGAFIGAAGIVLAIVGYRRRRRSASPQDLGAQQVHQSGNW